MEVHKRPQSSTGFHSERFAQPTYRRADSFADLDTLYHRTHNLHAPKPVKPRRTLSSFSTTSTSTVVPIGSSSNTSPIGGIAMQRMLSIDDEHYMAYEELHEILFSSSESDLDSMSDDGLHMGPVSPVEFSISTPIDISRPTIRTETALLATPPSRAPNPCSQNHIFRADGDDGPLSPSPPSAVSMSNERRYQHAY